MYESETEVEMPWVYNDGGYATSGFTGKHPNQVVVALAIATGQPYRETYHAVYRRQVEYVRRTRRKHIKAKGAAISEVGVWPEVSRAYLRELDWTWTPVMKVGSGVTMHLRYDELPDEVLLIASVSRGLVTVVNGVAQAIDDPSRGGSRAVYGFWTPPQP